MSRISTTGFEVGWFVVGGSDQPYPDGRQSGTASGRTATRDTTLFRSGLSSAQITTSSPTENIFMNQGFVPGAAGTTYFVRDYFNFTNLPTSTAAVLALADQTVLAFVSIRVDPTGHVKLWDELNNVQIGSDSGTVLATGVWYELELAFRNSASANSAYAEARVNLVSFASTTTMDSTATAHTAVPSRSMAGWVTSPGATGLVVNIDDQAINDSNGATQNTWPGEGRVVLLNSLSDNARTGWTAGAGGTTNLFDAVNNIPPAGTSAAAETNSTQIKDLVSSATDNYDVNITDYLTAGIQPTDTITLVQAVVEQGQAVTTGTKNGAVKIVSNPAQSGEDSFVYGNNTGAAISSAHQGWYAVFGTAQVGDIAAGNRATQPVLRVGKRTATNREVDVDFMGLYVEYIQGLPVSALHPFMDGPWTNTLLRM